MRNIHLTPQLIRAVREAADILGIASDYTRLTRRGQRWVGLCPVHKERTPSFSVDPEQGLFYCFGCGAGGDAIKLHQLASGDDFPAAIETLARRYGIPLPTAPSSSGGQRRERGIEGALSAAWEFFRRSLSNAAEPRAYLERRRISGALSERFGLGYAPPGWRDLLDALDRKVPAADLEAAGLLVRKEQGGRPYDRFRHRLIFPIFSPAGRLVGFGGRTLGDDRAKYINSNETEEFHKSHLLYGLHLAKRAIRETSRALLVEGYFDVLAAVASGFEGAVASMGTSLTQDQARLLARYADEVIVGYDGDPAGDNAFRRAVPLLLAEDLAVRRAEFGAGQDPDSLRLEAGEEAVRGRLEQATDGVMLELARLIPTDSSRQPHQQAKAATAVAELLRPIKDPVVRLGYGRLAAQRLGLPVEMILKRGKSEAAPATTAPPAVAPARREVGSLEEEVLALLLAEGVAIPSLAELPPPAAFFDPVCRNIFSAFCALYAEAGHRIPTGREVAAALETEQTAVDRLAQVLLERPVTPEAASLPPRLAELQRRWQRGRIAELARDIAIAEQTGDRERLEFLLREKTALSQQHHRSRQPASRRSPG